jgi:MoaA/NifB/PqqE/SkfB family radical SAM enzyme
MCRIKKTPEERNLRVDINKIFSIIREASKMGIRTLVLSGGEPFLVKDIFKIVDYAKKENMNVSVTTNGVYSEEMAWRIASSNVDHVHFSLDGMEKTHDMIRGKGSFSSVIRNIKIIRDMNPNKSLGFGTVIMSVNCREIFEMTKLADSLGINVMNFIPYLINNVAPQRSPKGRRFSELWPDKYDIIELKNQFSKIERYNYKNLSIERNPSFKQLIEYYSLEKIAIPCYAGYKSMIITSLNEQNGEKSSEVFFCQDSCGNVYERGIRRCWYSKKAFKMRLIAKRCRNSCLQFCHYI